MACHWSRQVQEKVDVNGHISKGYTEFYNSLVVGTSNEVHILRGQLNVSPKCLENVTGRYRPAPLKSIISNWEDIIHLIPAQWRWFPRLKGLSFIKITYAESRNFLTLSLGVLGYRSLHCGYESDLMQPTANCDPWASSEHQVQPGCHRHLYVGWNVGFKGRIDNLEFFQIPSAVSNGPLGYTVKAWDALAIRWRQAEQYWYNSRSKMQHFWANLDTKLDKKYETNRSR